jgi:hypothetical protein
MKRLPFFYGWIIVAVTFVTMAIGVNARTAFSLLFPPILSEFGWERGVTAGAPARSCSDMPPTASGGKRYGRSVARVLRSVSLA